MWILFLFLLFSPAHPAGPPEQLPVKELAGYLSSFAKQSHGKVRLKDLTDSLYVFKKLSWEKGKGGTIADCLSMLHTAPFTIEADPHYWSTIGPVDRWAIMFHELGHCACGLDHTAEKGSEWLMDLMTGSGLVVAHSHKFLDGCPDSLMYWAVPQKTCILVHRDEYLDGLFKKCKRPIRLAIFEE